MTIQSTCKVEGETLSLNLSSGFTGVSRESHTPPPPPQEQRNGSKMSDSEDSNFSEDESEHSSEAEEVEENEVRLKEGRSLCSEGAPGVCARLQ